MDCRRTLVILCTRTATQRPRFNPGSKSAGPISRPISFNTRIRKDLLELEVPLPLKCFSMGEKRPGNARIFIRQRYGGYVEPASPFHRSCPPADGVRPAARDLQQSPSSMDE